MSCLGNILWFIFGGFFNALGWFFIGILWCITIIGIPIGKQCFKMAELQLAPFGKEVVTVDDGAGSLIFPIIFYIIVYIHYNLTSINIITST